MKQQIEKTLADIFTRHSDRRLDVYKLQVESADASTAKLTGRVLTPESLEETRRALPNLSLNLSAVKVLRPQPGPAYTVATTLTDLHVEPSFLSELLTQIVNGAPLEVLDESPDGDWLYVRQSDGYLGWAYKSYLAPVTTPITPTHILAAHAGILCKEPQQTPLTRLLMGTQVQVLEEKGDSSRVQLPGPIFTEGWLPSASLQPLANLPLTPHDARKQVVSHARSLLGVYYLWGGNSPWGTDCSGLAQLTHKLTGHTLPRDADMQFAASTPVEAPYQAGDLFFFHSKVNKNKITHVGICTGGTNVIHSSRSRNGVYEEDMQSSENLRPVFAGARTFIPR